MILSDFFKALGQIGDRRFRRVLFLGLALTLALLVSVYALFLWVIQSFAPDVVNIPFVGPVGGLDTLLTWGSAILMLGLSIFLMVPVASAFSGLFLEDVAAAVEDRYYPHLPPGKGPHFFEGLVESFNFFFLIVAVNVVAIVVSIATGPLMPLIFWAVNGFLLGREYFTLVARRRLGREGASALRSRHDGQIWLAGILMAAPLSIPIVNLFVPLLGVATFTHMFHRLNRQPLA